MLKCLSPKGMINSEQHVTVKKNKYKHMKELIKQYQAAKKKALKFMKNGQLSAYFDALIEMNHYKRLMLTINVN
ncbi:MAG: hypothetical protein COB01_10850 [Lutibacter sp.]|nr:MAG: hypothetical protein COB01_10850 [Lutibacter sp.]